jgi:SAM-dependent methyltransferase
MNADLMSAELTHSPKTDPTSIYRGRDGLYAVDLLTAALVSLDFFSWLDEHPSDKASICQAFEIKDRPADAMLTLFTAMGFLKQENGVFKLAEIAQEHLVKSSPWFIGPYFASLKDRPVCRDMLTVLRTDKPANWGSLKSEKEWARAMEDEKFANQFTAAMDCRGVFLGRAAANALDLRDHKNLLDVAGGSGIYACSIVAHHPGMIATVFEKSPVDQVARNAIARRGFSERVSVVAGDMFAQPLPAGFDVHLISNVLHDWDVPVVKQILEKSFAALSPGGLLVIHDAHLNEDKSGPLHVAEYSVLLMHSTEGRCYSLAEMNTWLQEVGFSDVRHRPTAASRSIILAARPA